jgi:membrane fusion protein (multidrug efflux system)
MTISKFCHYGCLLYVAAIFCSCSTHERDNDNLTEERSINSLITTPVTTYCVKKVSFITDIPLTGVVKSNLDQVLYSEKSEKSLKCFVINGQTVSKNQVLARFENLNSLYRLRRDSLTKYNAQKEYESLLVGYESLLKNTTAKQANAIRMKLKISTGLATVEQDITEALTELKNSTLVAPFAGVVSDLNFHTSEQVKAGQALCRIYNPYSLYLEADILESDLASLKLNTKVEILPISNSNIYPGRVSEINPYVSENGTIKIKIQVATNSLKRLGKLDLVPGMHCKGVVHVETPEALIVPKVAVVVKSNRSIIFTAKNGKAVWNEVTVGRDNGREVEIIKGLISGDKVITSNNLQLSSDAPISEIISKH